MSGFSPIENSRAFRSALGAFATGVTVVTTLTKDGPVGMTANSFAAVSLDPPLVLWSPAKSSKRFNHFVDATDYAIHVLSADQRHICEGFTQSKDAFSGLVWSSNSAGTPILSGAMSVFECTAETVHDAGDHAIILGRVYRAETHATVPLIFHAGRFGQFRDAD